MKISRIVEKDGLIVTHFGGIQTLEHIINALNELIEINKGKKIIFELVINSDDVKLKLSRDDEFWLTTKLKETFEIHEFGVLAVVSNDDFVFGITRMLAARIEPHICVAVFRTEKLAREWIKEIRLEHNKGNI
ncbi:MAG: hypothetical protein GY760_03920 [Deltaproteobacteria bacterium]|nr:hypothetical protein [Deltaproteobacteria bacterium]